MNKRTKLQKLSDTAKKELCETENLLPQANEIEFQAKWKFDRCIERSPVGSHTREDVDRKLERLQHSVAVCMSLLDSSYISNDVVDSCETEVKEGLGMLQHKRPVGRFRESHMEEIPKTADGCVYRNFPLLAIVPIYSSWKLRKCAQRISWWASP